MLYVNKNVLCLLMFAAAGPHCVISFLLCCALTPDWSHFTPLFYFLPFEMYVFELFHFSVCVSTELNVLTSMVCVLFDSVRLSGEEGWSIKAWIKAVLMMLLLLF